LKKIYNMKSKKTIFCVMISLFIGVVSAQETEIKKIRQMYNDFGTQIKQLGEGSFENVPLKIEITSTVNERALGPVTKTVTMYYDRKETLRNNNFVYSSHIRKIEIREESSTMSYTEFFFDPSENLIFSFYKHDGYLSECNERRYYFKDGHLIRTILNSNPHAANSGDCNAGTRDTGKLTQDDQKDTVIVKTSAANYIELFRKCIATL
jgi:hypothetical protein